MKRSTFNLLAGRCIEKDGAHFVTIHKCEWTDPCEADRFARLCAAAPDLLASLEEFSGVWERGETFASMDVDAIELMRDRARRAIAKAKEGGK